MLTCTFENGSKASLRHVCVNALALKDGKLLLVRRAPHLTNPDKLALVGGFLDRGETSENAMSRELKEETGYDGTVVALFCIIDNPKRAQEDRQNVAFVYVMNVGEKTGEADDESTEVTLFPLDNLPQKEEWAFDHFEIVELYLQQCKSPRPLPFFKSV